MAVPHTAYRVSQTANADSLSIRLPDGIVANDIIYAIVSVRRVNAALAGTGYNAIINSPAGTTWATYHMAKIAAGGESSISITNTGATLVGTSATMIANIYIIKDGDVSGTAANAVDMSAQAAWSSGLTMSSPTGTVSSNNCTVIHSAVWDLVTPSVAPSDLNTAIGPGAAGSVASGMRLQTSSGALATFNWVGDTARSGNSFVVAFKNGSGGSLPTYLQDNRSVLARFSGYETYTWVALSTIAASINGINCSSTVATRTTGAIPTSADWVEPGTRLDSSESSGLPCWSGAVAPISCDLSGGNLSIQAGIHSVWDSTRIGSGGIIAVFWDGTNYEAHQLRTLETGAAYQGWTTYLTPGQTIPLAYSGTLGGIDWSAITHIGLAYHRASTAGSTTVGIVAGRITLDDGTSIFVGGGSNYPVRAESEYKCLVAANTMSKAADLGGKGQLLLRGIVQYGDGTTPITVKHTSQSIETPLDTDANWHCAESSVPIVIRASDSCVIDFSGHILASNTRQPFAIHASSSTLANYNFVATAFIGRDVTWKTGVPCAGALFSSCFVVDGKSASFTACTFTGCQLTSGAYLALDGGASSNYSDAPLISSSFTRGTEDYAIECRTAGYYDFSDSTFSGYTNEIYVSAASGTVTIRLAEGQAVPSYVKVGGSTATVTFDTPELYQSVTISGLTSGSRVHIYDTTAATELANSTQASPGSNVTWTSATAMTWTDSVAAVADRTIRVRIAYVSGTSAKGFIEANIGTCGTTGSEAVSYLANQVDDAVYNTNGIDGPSIYATSGITFTDSGSNDRINCNIGGGAVSWGTIYACFAYWMSTATGIADDIAYVTAVDTANYLLDSLKIKNTSATPLTITGGWGRDATSLTIADCIDTAGSTGNIFPQPDHVVAYATGSGSLTAGDITNIWSNGSRTLTTTIPSAADNASAVATVAVDGSVTLAESLRLQNSILGGKLSGVVTGTETFRSLADDKDRITVTVDSVGNRSAVVRDLT